MILVYEEQKHIFRRYDIRGIFGKDLTPEIVSRIGLSVAFYSPCTFAVGGDIRKSTPIIMNSLISGLTSGGVDVYDIGIVPIGTAIYSTFHKGLGMAYVTASHLPPEWNGIKLSRPKGDLMVGRDIVDIMNIFYSKEFSPKDYLHVGKVVKVEILEEYTSFLLKHLKGGNLKVVIDCGNGVAAKVAPQILRDLGYKVVTINCDIDPRFPARGSEPEPEKLQLLSKIVRETNADFGVAFDGDGDRTLFLDEKGNFLSAEQAAIVMLEGGERGDIVANVECSTILDSYAQEKCCKIYRVPVGRTFMIRKMQKRNAVLGVESSGHFVASKNLNMDDGIVTLIYFAYSLSNIGKPLSQIIPEKLPFKRIRIDVANDKVKFALMEKLKDRLATMSDKVSFIDGIRIDLEHGWVLIRPSNTEPVIRVTIEAYTEEKLKSLEDKFLGIIREQMKQGLV